jgi:hypothetical protein
MDFLIKKKREKSAKNKIWHVLQVKKVGKRVKMMQK